MTYLMRIDYGETFYPRASDFIVSGNDAFVFVSFSLNTIKQLQKQYRKVMLQFD